MTEDCFPLIESLIIIVNKFLVYLLHWKPSMIHSDPKNHFKNYLKFQT